MSDETQAYIASFIAALVGAYIALSPLWTTMTHGVMVSAIATGSVIAVASLWQMVTKSTLPSWINGIAAAWLIVGALTMGTYTFAILSQIVAGVAVFLFAGWDGAEVSHYNREHLHIGTDL